ncbi:FMN-dependent NADH-azoreductase 2 [Oenococcus oeni]|uniref:NAD(P)H-dependent oxidoreductase n=1 Tax=Oenococcus oeni TaxID=1247 RepID=UPI0010BC602F|nr:NAD(P)H-dependent oxidoreductase [Oenococcus oeni]SYV99836.1 FMN-dependent NADH-azoreductase 2 [Oenococcus oeni]SYW03735.1 FMN-dependent NADH-azoreductase 2 [Oenococcus oeni]SYW17734.1 FMN-dependent NADH-azoreductase 2 [Oenococcus oeni]VDC14540.1 FMN-dependent NADH-azoreductase 2 [Oenococcus oeni]
MNKVLVVKAHPKSIDSSKSLQIGKVFIESYKKSHPDDQVTIRDVYADKVPLINNENFDIWKKFKFGKDFFDLPKDQQQLMKGHVEWLDEFLENDKYVFINPMYNLFLPAELKQYFDVVAIVGKTFKYTEKGPVGLLKNKKAFHIQSTGGIYQGKDNEDQDIGDLYLRAIMKLFGINDYQSVLLEGVDNFPDQAEKMLNEASLKAMESAKVF